MMRNKFSRMAISSSIALLSLLVPTVFFPEIAPAAEDEVRECDPEPTDMTVTYGDRITCKLSGGGDSDIFRLQGTAGDRIIFGLTCYGFHCAKLVEVIDPSGNTIDKDSGSGVRYGWTWEQTGTYTFIVSPGSTGSYLIEISCVLGSCLASETEE